MVDAVLSFAVVAALLTITPGLDTALILRTAARGSRRVAFASAAGILTGVLAWALAATVGLSALLAASETAYTVLSTPEGGAARRAFAAETKVTSRLVPASTHSHFPHVSFGHETDRRGKPVGVAVPGDAA